MDEEVGRRNSCFAPLSQRFVFWLIAQESALQTPLSEPSNVPASCRKFLRQTDIALGKTLLDKCDAMVLVVRRDIGVLRSEEKNSKALFDKTFGRGTSTM